LNSIKELYIGNFSKDIYEGYGVYIFLDGSFQGQFKTHLRSEFGIDVFKNKMKYQGEFY